MKPQRLLLAALLGAATLSTNAEDPSVAYIFPAGGQRGTTVNFRVGGHFFHGEAGFEMLGPGVTAAPRVRETNTIWFEGPMIVQPASQGKEDYPRDHAGSVRIAGDATAGMRHWRVWTSQGATASMKFLVGDLPEVVEQEQDGVALPVAVQPPVTINGRIFPREDVDVWSFAAKAGQEFTCTVAAQALGSPLQARLVALDPAGRQLAEAVASPRAEPRLHFRAAADGTYAVRLNDVSFGGLQHYVYRLTITADPVVTSVFPLGGRRGETVKLELAGNALPARTAEIKLPADAAKSFSTPLTVGGKQTGPVRLEVDELPEHLAAAGEAPATFLPPATLNGRITKPGAANVWTFPAKKGDALELVLAAARLGSPLTPVLTISDGEGKPLGRVEAAPGDAGDATLQFKAPEDGTFTLRVTERFTSRGGPDFAYRLRVAPPAVAAPDFQLTLVSDAVNVVRDLPDGAVTADPVKKPRNRQKPGQLKLNVAATGGFAGEIELTVDGLPSKVVAANTKIAAKKATHDLSFNAEPLAKIAATRVTIRGTAMIGGQSVTRVATLPAPRGDARVDTVLLAVAMPTPFKVGGEYSMTLAPRGTVFQKHFTLERGGFTGPLTVQLADRQGRHLQGVTGGPLVVPPDAESFDYPVFLPPWMELGRTSRSVIATLGVIKDHDGTEHIVSYSSGEQNDQLIAVMETGRLDVASRLRSLAVTPGKTATLDFHLQRDAVLVNEPVRVELVLPPHILGVKAAPVVVPAGKDAATLTITFAVECGPFNAPALLRATTLDARKPHVAETKLELIPPAGLRIVTK